MSEPRSMLTSDFNNPDIGAAALANSLFRLESSPIPPQGPVKIIAAQKRSGSTTDLIQELVSKQFNLRELHDQNLKARTNRLIIAFPRQVAMYIARQLTTMSLQEIGRQFGGMHHTTVLHSINKVEEMRRSDRALNHTITQLMNAL